MSDVATITAAADRVESRLSATGRRCPKCGETKPLSDFPLHRARAGGRYAYCRACHRESVREYRRTEAGRRANVEAWYRSVARAKARRLAA